MSKILFKPTSFIVKKIFYFALVPLYKIYLKAKNKTRDIFGLNQKTNLYLATHRHAIHFLIIILTTFAVLANWRVGETRAEAQYGQDILLGSLVETEELGTFVEEYAENMTPQVTSYAKVEELSVESTPGIESANREESFNEKLITTTEGESSLIKPEILSSQKNEKLADRYESIAYVVKKGETISAIAKKFGLNTSTVLWNNNLSEYSIIKPGQKLTIPPLDGIEHIVKKNETLLAIAKKYKANLEKILDYNNLINADDIFIGQKLFIPGGRKPYFAPLPRRSRLASLIIPNSAPIVSKTRMLWPTNSKRITQYYSWRHSGVDIGGGTSNAIYASDSGTVAVADGVGWNGGYGKYIIINHGGNKKTLYAHLSKIFIQPGKKVSKGQVIGMMGTTGRSTGVHLHFEVRFGNFRANPLKYVK